MSHKDKVKLKAYNSAYVKRDRGKHNKRVKDWYRKNAAKVIEKAKIYRENNKEKVQAQRKASYAIRKHVSREWFIRSKYGITIDEYNRLLELQGGVCAICRRPEKAKGRMVNLSIDHDHQTGKVRGLLCNFCNRSLPLIENMERLRNALRYIEDHSK